MDSAVLTRRVHSHKADSSAMLVLSLITSTKMTILMLVVMMMIGKKMIHLMTLCGFSMNSMPRTVQ